MSPGIIFILPVNIIVIKMDSIEMIICTVKEGFTVYNNIIGIKGNSARAIRKNTRYLDFSLPSCDCFSLNAIFR